MKSVIIGLLMLFLLFLSPEESLADDNAWEKYSTNYYYNQLEPEFQEAWDKLDAECLALMSTTKKPVLSGGTYRTDYILMPTTDRAECDAFLYKFAMSNPQYYFLKNYYFISRETDGMCVAIGIYDKFAEGNARKEYTDKFFKEVEKVLSVATSETDDVQIVRKFHDAIVEKVSYNHDALNIYGNLIDENESMTQSAYSAFCLNTTLCAGYAEGLQMLCNAAGIDAVCVTSPSHQWNKIRINDRWYNVDPTSDDPDIEDPELGTPILYTYFARSDEFLSGEDSKFAPWSYWDGMMPECTTDAVLGNPYGGPGELPPASTSTTQKPVITIKETTSGYQVTITSSTSNARIYYTLDGTTPSEAATKAIRYRGTFYLKKSATLTAIAVSEGKKDSATASKSCTVTTYGITYKLNGGKNNLSNPSSYTKYDTITLSNPSRKGYTFAGWYTDSEYTNKVTKISNGTTGNKTLYAKWKAITYTITYWYDGRTSTTDEYTAATPTFSLKPGEEKGYRFEGWYKEKKYVNKVTQIEKGTTGNIELYAKWTPIEYTVKYYLNGGSMPKDSTNPTTYMYDNPSWYLDEPVRKGYEFAGWYRESTFKNEVEYVSGWNLACNLKLYAKWKPNTYKIYYESNGGTGYMDASDGLKYGTSYTLRANTFKRTGYTFVGWNTKADGTGTSYKNKQSIKNLTTWDGGRISLYAQWKKTKYTITYKLNGGKNSTKNPAGYYKTSATITLKNPTRTGYKFAGWYSDSKLTKKVTKIVKGSSGNKTLYAKWTANKYNVKFKGNGATSGSMKKLSDIKYGKTYTLKTNPYKRKGYTFAGWNTRADGKGTSYKNAARIKNLTSTSGKTITLYAQWKKTKYTITYKLNGGKNNSKNPSSYYVTTSTITLKNPTRAGYVFKGWYKDSKYKNKVTKIKKGSTGKVTLYAKWKKK